jgi:hypothetical protein
LHPIPGTQSASGVFREQTFGKGATAMRAALPLLVGCVALVMWANQPNQVISTPPTVSYRVQGNDIPATNDQAQNYCAQYGRAAQYRGDEDADEGEVAVFTCDGERVGALRPTPAAPSGSTTPPDGVGPPTLVAPAPPR